MKKIRLSVLFFIGITLNLISQTNYGIKGGINYTNINLITEIDYDLDNKYKIDFHVGGFIKKSLNEKWNFKPELLFSRKGYSLKEINDMNPKVTTYFDYISLPILFEYKIINKLNVEMGPEVGYLISAKSKRENEKIDISDRWDNKFDIGLGVGINYNLNEKIDINLRYIHGLLSIMKDTEFIIYENNASTTYNTFFLNNTFQLSLNYILK